MTAPRPFVPSPHGAERTESHLRLAREDDLAYLNRDPAKSLQQWEGVPASAWDAIEERVRRTVRVRDDFVTIPFPRVASLSERVIADAVAGYRREAAIVDPRLSREVTLRYKGTALSDLCDDLRRETGIRLEAGSSVADEKVTLFCRKMALRDVMRQLGRSFGYIWQRRGKDGAYRYELLQDLKSQLLEEELRNRDRQATLLALDEQMQAYRPFLSQSFAELRLRWEKIGQSEWRQIWSPGGSEELRQLWRLIADGAWGGAQLYHCLTPGDRAALLAGQELVFRPDAPHPDRRIPAELIRPLLQSMGEATLDEGRRVPIADIPGVRMTQVRLRLQRTELGAISLTCTRTASHTLPSGGESRISHPDRTMAQWHFRSMARPDNAKSNAGLRGQPPLNLLISLRPKPSCPVEKDAASGQDPRDPRFDIVPPLTHPRVTSADVWEAIHEATGRPILADFYTRLYPLEAVTVAQMPLFDALCRVGDAMGIRWRGDGAFLIGRSASYFWDKQKEVPSRHLQRWARHQEAEGGLPLADFLEMATMTDEQLDADAVAEGIEQYWGLREWSMLHSPWGGGYRPREYARLLAALSPEQTPHAFEPKGLPVKVLTPAQQQILMQIRMREILGAEQEGGWPTSWVPENFTQAVISAEYQPAGTYLALVPPEAAHGRPWDGPMFRVGGRTRTAATEAARRLYPRASPQEVRQLRDGYFAASVLIIAP